MRLSFRSRTDARRAARVDLATAVGTVALPTPIILASGVAGHGAALSSYMDLDGLGAMVVKSLSSGPWPGNPEPRLFPVRAGMLNSVGLQNPGLEAWARDDLPRLSEAGARIVVSIWASTAGSYLRVADDVKTTVLAGPFGSSVVAVEANISCPNLEESRRLFAHSRSGARAAVSSVRRGLDGSEVPLWVKLSPNVTDLAAIAEASVDAGADALTLVNTLMGMSIDPLSGVASLGARTGGLSGPALHPVAVKAVYDTRSQLPEIPIIGVGGVSTGADAAELLAAGAAAVGVGTAAILDPRAPERIASELRSWCAANAVQRIGDLVGRAFERRLR